MADSKRARSWKRRTLPRIDLINAEPVLYSTWSHADKRSDHEYFRLCNCKSVDRRRDRNIFVFQPGANRRSRRTGRQELPKLSQTFCSQTSAALFKPREHLEKKQGPTREGNHD